MYGILKDGPKFKVGDRVINSWSKTPVYTVASVEDGGRFTVRDYIGSYDPEYFNFAPAFLPGDMVRVTKHSGYFAAGDIGEVESQSADVVYLKHGSYQRLGLPIDADSLELVGEQEATWSISLDTSGYATGVSYQPEPKFRAGDWVRCVKDYDPGKQFTAGHHYQIKSMPSDTWLTFVADDGGSNSNGWGAKHFVAAAPLAVVADKLVIDVRPCIVARVVSGTPRPSNIPYVHGSVQAATAEAERLARNNPGKEFAVYQRVAGRVAEVSYSMKEVA